MPDKPKLTRFEQNTLDILRNERWIEWSVKTTTPSITRVLNRLVAKGYAAYRFGNDHMRGWIIAPTPKPEEPPCRN